jgi:hypothetical protein
MLKMVLVPLFAFGVPLVDGACVPAATPNADERKSAQTEIEMFRSFLYQPLCEQVAVKYQLAGDYAIIGDFDKAIALARDVAEADAGFDFPLETPFAAGPFSPFKPLADCPEFNQIAEGVHAKHPPVHLSTEAFTIPDRTLVPEGLAYNAQAHCFLMGSMNEKKIIRYTQGGNVEDFVPSGRDGLAEVLGIRMDPEDGSVWVASGLDAAHAGLFHFSPTGEFLAKYRPPDGKSDHLFNDLVVCRNGDVYLTDSTASEVYRLRAGDTKLVPIQSPRPLCYPNGIALSEDDSTVFIADAFGVLVLDRNNSSIRPIQAGAHVTLSGFDGMYTWKDCLVGVQNSLGSPRVVAVRLNVNRSQTIGLMLLEYRTELTQLPTTGAIVGDTLYYITNSQIDHYKDSKLLKPEELAPIVVAKVKLVEPSE